MHLQLLPIIISSIFMCTTVAYVKIDVSKLSSTTTVAKSESTTATTLVTAPKNETEKPSVTTTTPATITSLPTNKNITENTTSTTEFNQTAVNATRPSLDDHVPRTSRVKVSPDHYYCRCDLMVNFCDINCCCDNDCTDEMLSVFVCDEKQWSIFDYEYDAGLASCEIRNDLFCVVGKDIAPEMAVYDATLFGERSKYKWPVMFASHTSNDENRERYKSGDSVLAFDDRTEEIGAFVFPYSLTGDYCHTSVPIKFLDDHESKCLRSYDQMQTFREDFQLKLKSTKILQLRKVNQAMMLEHCTGANGSHCVDIQMVDCFGFISRDNCVRFNSSEIDETKWWNREIVIQFRHNFTNILNCSAYLIYSNEEMMPASLIHSVKIQFLQANESMANIHRISGNIGYMQGKPIITAKMIPLNDSDENSPKILDYFHPNKTFSNDEHFLKIPAIKRDLCVLTNLTYDIIRFGENLFSTCDVALDDSINVTAESNFTEICSTLQRKIFSFMLNEYHKSNDTNDISLATKISEFGNPKNDSNYWTNANLKHGIVDAVQSKYEPDDNGSEFICQNMILSTSFEFLYASLRVGSFEHQNLIKNLDVIFGTRVDLKFNFNETIKVPIFLDITFIDLTNSASVMSSLKWMVVIIFMIGLVDIL